MSSNFLNCLNFSLKAEGGYVNDKDDSGGPTNLGITQYIYDNCRKKHGYLSQDVRLIKLDEMIDIYYYDYYKASGADKINNPRMAILVFDTAVHCGPGNAKIFYKRSDGSIDKYFQVRKSYYDEIIKKYPKNIKYKDGWNNRLIALRKYLSSMNPSQNLYDDMKSYVGITSKEMEKAFEQMFKKYEMEQIYKKIFPYYEYNNIYQAEESMELFFPNSKYFIEDNKENGH